MGFGTQARARRAKRALERQLDYQRRKSAALAGREKAAVASMVARSKKVRDKLEAVAPIGEDARVLEVGSGAHGLIFAFGSAHGVGVDPLADHYAELFPWQGRARTITAFGEALPFPDASFDVVLCDNVVDHAEQPRKIVEEMTRVLRPGGLLYFTVNVHHPVYHGAAKVHAAWQALGVPFEVSAFADHTVHLTPAAAGSLFDGLGLRIVSRSCNVDEAKHKARQAKPRHLGDRLKRLFYKNAVFEVIAIRAG